MSGLPIGKQVSLPGHFDVPVVLEAARPLARGFECRVRLPDGSLDEAVITADEAAALGGAASAPDTKTPLVNADQLRLLIESARIRRAYAHDKHFAVSLWGIRTLPHQIEAVYVRMLPQPRLRFLLADDPGAGKTIMADLLVKEMKLREAIERVLILCPSPLFPDRHAHTITFKLSREEYDLYKSVTAYINEFLTDAQPNLEQLKLVCQALGGPALKGGELADISAGAEQSALGKLTANWQSVVEGRSFQTLNRPTGVKARKDFCGRERTQRTQR